MFGNINSGQLRAGARSGCRPAAAPCVPFNLFGGAGSITQEMIDFVSFVQNDSSEQKAGRPDRPTCRAACSSCPADRSGSRSGVEYRDLKGRFDPDPDRRGRVQLRHSGAAHQGQLQRQGSLCRVQCAAAGRRAVRRPARAERRGALLRLFDVGIGSTTTFKAGVNWKPIEDLRLRGSWARRFPCAADRRAVRHPVALRPGARRSLLVAREQPAAAPLQQ